jgi:hypothetical protein
VELSIWGWEFRNKAAVHERLGPVFLFVTTGLNRLVCADPSIARTIMSRRKDFVHLDITTKAMRLLGANIVTVKSDFIFRALLYPRTLAQLVQLNLRIVY